jgi:pyocin large subunit-like protein
MIDCGATVVPFVPGGVTTAIKGWRAGRSGQKLLTHIYKATNFASDALLNSHFAKHAAEWGAGNITMTAYLKRARDLLSRNPGGDILEFVREGGDVLRYNTRTNEFAIGTADGVIRTLFRPGDGFEYWLRTIGRP